VAKSPNGKELEREFGDVALYHKIQICFTKRNAAKRLIYYLKNTKLTKCRIAKFMISRCDLGGNNMRDETSARSWISLFYDRPESCTWTSPIASRITPFREERKKKANNWQRNQIAVRLFGNCHDIGGI
jgi:hypothetical protein